MRVHFRDDSEVALKSKVKIGLICKEQLIDADEDAAIHCWEYNGVEFRAGGDIDRTVAFLEQRMNERARTNSAVF